ncbi:MAG: hypothetical protein ACRBCT_04905 [Alphaproteobacteria bacterium]
MITPFTPDDIYPIRYASLRGERSGHAGGTILLHNSYGIHFAQDQINPSSFSLDDSTFTIIILAPYDTPELAATNDHPLTSFRGNSHRYRVPWAEIALITSDLQKAEQISGFTPDIIIRPDVQENAPYHATQLGKEPIRITNGLLLDKQILRQWIAQGRLRDPFDFESPIAQEKPDWTTPNP